MSVPEKTVTVEPSVLEERITGALLYMAKIKQPSVGHLAHIRSYLLGEHDEHPEAYVPQPPPVFIPAQQSLAKPVPTTCGVSYYGTDNHCVRARNHPCYSVDGIGHSYSPEHLEK